MKNSVLVFLCMLSSIFIFGQASKNINNYKYVIVPNKFDFLKEENQYKANALTHFLFDKKFTAFLGDENVPKELITNKCGALLVNFIDESGMFTSKLKLEIKNCVGDVLYTSEGKSKEKSYEKAYQEAIRDAYAKFDEEFEYNYQPIKNDISVVEDETEIIEVVPVVKVPIVKTPVTELTSEKEEISTNTTVSLETLYAQKKVDGFQLVNTKPEIVFYILKTKVQDVYIIKDKNGILYNSNGIWIAEFLEGDTLKTKNYQIKF